jgi:hypothetical protein
VPSVEVRAVRDDEYGPIYADRDGYLYRDPAYAPRYAAMASAPGYAGSWVPLPDGWFRSVERSREYAPGALEVLFRKAEPVRGLAWLALGATALWFGAPILIPYATRLRARIAQSLRGAR